MSRQTTVARYSHGARIAVGALACAGLLLGGCAASPDSVGLTTNSLSKPPAAGKAATTKLALSDEEKGLSCSRIVGRMQLLILEARYTPTEAISTLLSNGLHQTVGQMGLHSSAPVTSGTRQPTVAPLTASSSRHDKLEALNHRLAELNCPTYDLVRVLDPASADLLPRPSIPPQVQGAGNSAEVRPASQ